MYTVKWEPKARKQLNRIGDRKQKVRILDAVHMLENFPEVPNVKALTNHQHQYRLRVGKWRVLFNAHEQVEIISIEEVKKRDERTY